MYKRNHQGWLKHLDFMASDLIAQQLALIISYCIYNNRIELPYVVPAYRTIGVLLILIDVMFLIITDIIRNIFIIDEDFQIAI